MKKKRKAMFFLVILLGFLTLVANRRCFSISNKADSYSAVSRDRTPSSNARDAESPDETELREYVQRGNVPIRFYGRVTDENGAGLAGVSVEYRIQKGAYLPGSVKVHSDRGKVMSGGGGEFAISDGRGSSLAVGPFVKDGYRDAQREIRDFGYMGTPKPHDPNPQDRVQFLMVKDGIPSAKKVYDKRLRFAWNSGEARIPLELGVGDLILIPTRVMPPGRSSPDRRDPFSWSVRVILENAELVSMPATWFPVTAPDSGYQKEVQYGHDREARNWSSMLNEKIAFKTRDGRYGLVLLSIYVTRNDFDVNGSIKILINESGARNFY
jgi:hypothetical protein